MADVSDLANAPDGKRPTLRQIAHARFMDKLYSGGLKPGEFISQRELCVLLDVPMGPMREALKRLEAETIVTLIPQRGIKILDIDEKSVNDAFQLRLLIEVEAVRVYASGRDRAAASDLLRRTEAAVAEPRSETARDLPTINRLTNLDHEMHRLFLGALRNAFADELFERMLGRLRLSRLVYRLRYDRDRRALREHIVILSHVVDGAADAAAEALDAHLRASWDRALGLEPPEHQAGRLTPSHSAKST